MSVTEHSSIYGAPRCTESRFVALLDSYGSFDSDALWGPFPRVERPDVARRIYRLFADAGLDPLFQLGITVEEHTAGTNRNSVLWRGMTHSWGNARTRRDPSVISETYFDPIRNSNYQRYHDVLHSVRDIIYRLKEPTYAYAGKTSIRDVISTFAPEGNPQRYIDVTVQRMNTWIAQGGGMTAQIPGFEWFPANDTHHTKGRTAKITGGAQHYSAGTNSLAWLTSTSGKDDPKARVSATFLVRKDATLERRGWQLVRIEDTPWTTSFANPYTVSIEYEHLATQSISDMDYEVLARTWYDVYLYLLERPHLGALNAIRGHKEWVNNPSLTCPDGINVGRIVERFNQLKAAGPPAAINNRLVMPPLDPMPIEGKLWPYVFHEFYRKHGGVPVFGLVKTGVFMERDDPAKPPSPENPDKLVAYAERARFEYAPHVPGMVQMGLVGNEVLHARYPQGVPA
jgi:hypothetical protein